MNEQEKEIRDFLNSLSPTEIIDSNYLLGIDLDNDSISDILNCIILLYEDVNNSYDNKKKNVLNKIMTNEIIKSQIDFVYGTYKIR